MSTTKGAPAGTRLTIRLPDDFHHHCRDGPKTAAILQHATQRFGRCLMMPNTNPPVTTTAKALAYKAHIEASMPTDKDYPHFQPLMTLYLTDKTTAAEIQKAAEAGIVGCKYYPAGATTNSDFGVTDIQNCNAALQEMSDRGFMLAIHSEVTHADIFEREPVFIEEVIKPLVLAFPKLKITMEHISTQEAVTYVLSAPPNVRASITCHHLLYNRNRTCALPESLRAVKHYNIDSLTHIFSHDHLAWMHRHVGGGHSASSLLPTGTLPAPRSRRPRLLARPPS
jgi:dihydroorotase